MFADTQQENHLKLQWWMTDESKNSTLQMFHVSNGHFYDFSFLNPSPSFLQIFRRDESAQIC